VFPARTPAGGADRARCVGTRRGVRRAENVLDAYGYYIDQFAWRDTAALFAADGWKELSYIGTFIGRDNVRDSMITRYGEAGRARPTRRCTARPSPTSPCGAGPRPDSRAAAADEQHADRPGSMIFGIYENQVVKEGGVWRSRDGPRLHVLADYAPAGRGRSRASSRFAAAREQLARFHIDAPLRG
jgi:hypothetical protein